MKTLLVLLLHPLHILEFFRDSNKYLKEEGNIPIRHVKKRTVYPDNYCDDFNEWTNYIYDEAYQNHRN